MSEREYEALRSALTSTRMEGFEITEQTERDCIRLMQGEISVADLVKEIMGRPSKAVRYGISLRNSSAMPVTNSVSLIWIRSY